MSCVHFLCNKFLAEPVKKHIPGKMLFIMQLLSVMLLRLPAGGSRVHDVRHTVSGTRLS